MLTAFEPRIRRLNVILPYLLAAFIIMPILELSVLFKVHDYMGLGNTLAIVIFTGVIGAFLAKAQGMLVIARIRRDLAEGRMPAPQLMDGVMILIAGVLLITPGLITDAAGFLLLVPAVRGAIRTWFRRKLEEKMRNGSVETTMWRW
ncbi:MAG: FxsA family protein [Lentisphaerae bacterium]|nr:FxsA family protein [Lentisphaerota bacterium]